MIRATSKGDGARIGARSASATTGVTVEVAHRDPHPVEPAHDADAGGDGIEGDLLGGLAQGGRGGIGVAGLGLAAGEADLARVMPVAGRPLDQDHACLALVVRVEQHEHGRRSTAPRGARHGRRPRLRPADEDGHHHHGRRRQRIGEERQQAGGGLEAHRVDRSPTARRGQLTSSPSSRLGRVGGRSSGEAEDRPRPRPPTATGSSSSTAPGVTPAGLADDGRALAGEHERAGREIRVGGDPVARPELAGHERPGQLVLDEPLDRALERPRPERRVGALADDERPGGGGQLQDDVLLGQPATQVRDQQVDDGAEVSSVRAWKTMTSSTRLRNSGRNCDRSASVTSRFICS